MVEATEDSVPPQPGAEEAPAQAIRNWLAKRTSATALMRTLVAYNHWELPITERSSQAMRTSNAPPEPWLYRDAQKRPRLFLFSNRDAWRRYVAAAKLAHDQPFATASGVSLFTRDLSALHAVHIDPLTDDALTLESDLFARLNVVADAVRVERALLQLRRGTARVGAQLAAVRSFAAWHVALHDSPDGARFAHAPDPRRRSLAAVFTLNDAFECFAQTLDAAAQSTLRRTIMNGETLFTELLDAGLDGIVFNCQGPTEPVAFAPAFARLVLETR